LRCWKVSLELGGGLGEENSLVSKNWDYGRTEIEFEEGLVE